MRTVVQDKGGENMKIEKIELTEKEVICIVGLISNMELNLPWILDAMNIDPKVLRDASDKMYKKTSEYSETQEEEKALLSNKVLKNVL